MSLKFDDQCDGWLATGCSWVINNLFLFELLKLGNNGVYCNQELLIKVVMLEM